MAYTSKSLWVGLVLLLLGYVCIGQNSTEGKKSNVRIKEKGFLIGAGYGLDTFNLPEGNYTPILLIGRIAIDFRNKNAIKKTKAVYSIFFEPQVNPVVLRNDKTAIWEFEFGVNIGFQHSYPLTKQLFISTFISTGPQYFSAKTSRQAPGFLFNDNFGMGIYYYVKNNIAVHLGFRLRHMSNAQIQMPNSGINTFNFMIGVSRILR